MRRECWLAQFSANPCEGGLIRAHLLPKQLIRREIRDREEAQMVINDPRSWVPCCGGRSGLAGHHAELDTTMSIVIPRSALPPDLEELAAEVGMMWWVDRHYGLLDAA